MLNNKALAYFLTVIFAAAAFVFVVIPHIKNPASSEIKNNILALVNEIIIVGELEKEVPDKSFKNYDGNIFSRVNVGLNYLNNPGPNDRDFGEKVFHLRFAIRYAEDAWKFAGWWNLVDAERYLKAARDHLEKAKGISKAPN